MPEGIVPVLSKLKRRFLIMKILNKILSHWVLILPSVIVLFLLTMFPLIFSLNVSLREYPLGGEGVKEFIWFSNFIKVLFDEEFLNSIIVLFKFVGIALAIELPLGIAIALLLNKPLPLLEKIGFLIFLPLGIAPAVTALMFRWFYSKEIGIIPYFLRLLHLPVPEWASRPVAALFSIIIADVWQWTPFVILIIMAGLQSIQGELYEAANVDGATRFQQLIHITLPLLKPTILVVLLLRAIPAMKAFDKFFIITAGGPGIATESTSMYIYKQMFNYNDLGTAAAASFLLLIVIIILSQILFYYLRRVEN